MTEARNLKNMTVQQTPLLGDENIELHERSDGGTGFEGATPRNQAAFTPNPLATPLRSSTDGSVSAATPRVAGTPLRTPMRDNLSINPDDGTSVVGETPRDERMRVSAAKRSLKASFMNLPRPENNFELLVPEEEGEEEGDDESKVVMTEEDAAARDARLKKIREEEERKALARRSVAVQLGLPRPPNVDLDKLLNDLSLVPSGESALEKAQRLVDRELVSLMQHDAIAYPLPGTMLPGSTESSYVDPEDELVALAKSEVQRELASAVGFPDAPAEQVKSGILSLTEQQQVSGDRDDENAQVTSWASLRLTLAYDAEDRTWKDAGSMSAEARMTGYRAQLEDLRASMAKQAAGAGKVEKKLGVTLGGYMKRASELSTRLNAAFDALAESQVECVSFERLRAQENVAGPARVDKLKEDVDGLERRERMLQGLYRELVAEREEVSSRVAMLEEKAMEEAERMNEEALAAGEA
jgi:pre-mRNA-splicing factor CDC5/CEF1